MKIFEKKKNKRLVVSIYDSNLVIKLMKQITNKWDYNFLGIRDPLEVLPTLISTNPDLIFLDREMPIFNGYEICCQIRNISRLKNVPIVLVSTNDNFKNQLKAKISGATDSIGKPLEATKITQILNKYLHSSSTAFDRARTKSYLNNIYAQIECIDPDS